MVGSHIDDLCICGINHECLDEFRFTLLDPAKDGFESTYEGPLHHYLGYAIIRALDAGTTSLLQDNRTCVPKVWTMECHVTQDAHDA